MPSTHGRSSERRKQPWACPPPRRSSIALLPVRQLQCLCQTWRSLPMKHPTRCRPRRWRTCARATPIPCARSATGQRCRTLLTRPLPCTSRRRLPTVSLRQATRPRRWRFCRRKRRVVSSSSRLTLTSRMPAVMWTTARSAAVCLPSAGTATNSSRWTCAGPRCRRRTKICPRQLCVTWSCHASPSSTRSPTQLAMPSMA
mmetsp:Transcript_76139/g.123702  ORF Transcript_76139/g.123702 Transcript_76139/m.123702 type:complete len:200 (-) Transcript_76139:717-1316(-)